MRLDPTVHDAEVRIGQGPEAVVTLGKGEGRHPRPQQTTMSLGDESPSRRREPVQLHTIANGELDDTRLPDVESHLQRSLLHGILLCADTARYSMVRVGNSP